MMWIVYETDTFENSKYHFVTCVILFRVGRYTYSRKPYFLK